MAQTGIFHHIGTFLLFASAVLLLIASISSPVINDIGLLRVHLSNSTSTQNSVVSFGTFGYCILDAYSDGHDFCSGKHIGYNPAAIMSAIDSTDFNHAAVDTSKALTRVMVLHPVGAVLAFAAFLLALGAGVFGALMASLVSAVAWIVTVVVMACDFTLFGIIRNHVNDDGSGAKAHYSVAMWCVLAAMVGLFFATFVVFFTCFSARMHKRRAHRSTKAADAGYINGTTTTRRHFWQRRSRY